MGSRKSRYRWRRFDSGSTSSFLPIAIAWLFQTFVALFHPFSLFSLFNCGRLECGSGPPVRPVSMFMGRFLCVFPVDKVGFHFDVSGGFLGIVGRFLVSSLSFILGSPEPDVAGRLMEKIFGNNATISLGSCRHCPDAFRADILARVEVSKTIFQKYRSIVSNSRIATWRLDSLSRVSAYPAL